MITRYKHGIVIFFLWVFAPIAWILMWQDKKYHSWFPTILLINGIVFGILLTTQSVAVFPQLDKLYTKYNIRPLPNFTPIVAGVLVGIAIFQVIYALILREKLKSQRAAIEQSIVPIIAFLTLDFVIGVLTGLLLAILPFV
jgi:hypothetical protein